MGLAGLVRPGALLEDAQEATARLVQLELLGEGGQIGEPERRRLVAFREGLRGLLLAHNGLASAGPDAETLNGLIATSSVAPR